MHIALTALLAVSGQPVLTPQPDLRACPTGVWIERDRSCPPIGAHPIYVYFDRGQATFNERARETLEFLAASLRARLAAGVDLLPFLIEGHADRSGSADYNLDLSRRRAEAVRNFLVAGGHAARLVPIIYFGEERPARATGDDIPEPDNRRVVIRHIDP